MHASADLAQRVTELLKAPGVRDVRLAGSRAEARPITLSDWDFLVEVENFAAVAGDLPRLLEPLEPLAQQWDRLSSTECWMLMLAGPTKVDLIFPDVPHTPEPPWQPAPHNLEAIDAHFWDWMLWLASKEARGMLEVIGSELEKAFEHLLAPLGAGRAPPSIPAAVEDYRAGRERAEARFAVGVDCRLESAVAPVLARMPS